MYFSLRITQYAIRESLQNIKRVPNKSKSAAKTASAIYSRKADRICLLLYYSSSRTLLESMSEVNRRYLPPGWGFYPTPYELAKFYLYPKVNSLPLPLGVVIDVKLYEKHPAELAELQKDKHEKAWYFFTPRERKYKNGTRPNRAVKENQEGQGYWKATGRDEEIKDPETNAVIALKKTLVYYDGKPNKDVKTDWIMQEYTMAGRKEQSGNADVPSEAERSEKAEASAMRLDDWVLCKIYLNSKGTRKRKKQEQEGDNDARKRKKKEQEGNNDARKHPQIDEDATNEDYKIDEEITKHVEDGKDQFLNEGQAVLPNPMTMPTSPIATENHRSLLTQHGGPLRYAQQIVWSPTTQATGQMINELQPMQAIGTSDLSTLSVQSGSPPTFGYPPWPQNQLQNFMLAPSEIGGLSNASYEPIHSSDLTYPLEAMQMVPSGPTGNSTIKVEDFTNLCGSLHNHFNGLVSQMLPASNDFQSQASFQEPQLAPYSDSLVNYYYESMMEGIEATADEALCIPPTSALCIPPISADEALCIPPTSALCIPPISADEALCIPPISFHSPPHMQFGDDFDCKPSSSNCQPFPELQ